MKGNGMAKRPNNERWDCGGHCIHGGLVGPGRECDDCWAGTTVRLSSDSDGNRNGENSEAGRVRSMTARCRRQSPKPLNLV